jgi:hypothetical protein
MVSQAVDGAQEIEAKSTTSPGHIEPPYTDMGAIDLTLLLISGLRVSLTLDDHYITTHSLPFREPKLITVGGLKQCLFDSWQEDWGVTPTSVANIRLIHLGKVLEEAQTLDGKNVFDTGPRDLRGTFFRAVWGKDSLLTEESQV